MFRSSSFTPGRLLTAALIVGLCTLVLVRSPGVLAAMPPPVYHALIGGLWAAAATAVGTLPVLLSQSFSARTYDAALGLGGGIMLAATSFSLVLPAIAASKGAGNTPMAASLMVGGGILIGMLIVMLLERLVRSDNVLDNTRSDNANTLVRAWLFVGAVAIHNIPEGMAIGVGYAGVDLSKANALTTGIAIQDIPEGMVVAMALRVAGYGRLFSAALGTLSGVVEPIGAVIGALMIEASAALLPWGLAGAAGAMLYVICHDVVPEAQRRGNYGTASFSLVIGFIIMMVLDTAMG
ncbi:UNVERIFIED_ORG: ZIP family zinc transporter [Zoogloea ramigera]|uniref:ZIP family metal transporter n=1 Tax=Duganella zoogloeoides TaxID=75659 RepID=A0ABZ0Y2Q9_9BURK|nr:ZIP family metal transporter [Duganella zoogloeoides]WQH06314.1 ZIP family metal transporter [Duganella zoogloeoides]